MTSMWISIVVLGAFTSIPSVLSTAILVEEAKDERIAMYQRAVKVTVEMSLNVSATMSKVVDEIFSESDRAENRAKGLQNELIQLTHSIITKGNRFTQCVNSQSPSSVLSKMFTALATCTKCLHEAARKTSQIETEIAVALNHFNTHVMDGMSALDKCKPSGWKSADETCLRTVNEELELQTESLWNNLLSIKHKVGDTKKKVNSNILACCKSFYKSTEKVKSAFKGITDTCQNL